MMARNGQRKLATVAEHERDGVFEGEEALGDEVPEAHASGEVGSQSEIEKCGMAIVPERHRVECDSQRRDGDDVRAEERRGAVGA